MSTFSAGQHEFGQNFLTDPSCVAAIVALAAQTTGPIIEIGAGSGALTLPLQSIGRPITAIEIDQRLVGRLNRRVNPAVTTVIHDDFLHHELPASAHAVVGNLPFHQTTSMLRKLLHADHWTSAVLLTQWEVARRRAGVGGATLMTAQWWPWFDFALQQRVPASSFTPRPGVDAGLLTINRRLVPLLTVAEQAEYQRFARQVFTSKGYGLAQIVPRVATRAQTRGARRWWATSGLPSTALPRDLSATQWVELFTALRT